MDNDLDGQLSVRKSTTIASCVIGEAQFIISTTDAKYDVLVRHAKDGNQDNVTAGERVYLIATDLDSFEDAQAAVRTFVETPPEERIMIATGFVAEASAL